MSERRRQDAEIFAAALAVEASERPAYVARQAGRDEQLKRDVMSLLRHHDAARDFLEVPLVSLDTPEGEVLPIYELLAPGQVLGQYRIVRHIGQGGMADVYLAEQQRPVRRKVAIKVVKPGMDTRQVVARMDQERQALALMNHPGIAAIFDAGVTEDARPYFVMEFFEASPIDKFCDRRALSIRDRLRLFREVCQAVQHAHQHGIVHRDLKPANVLVIDGAQPAPKVIDFGIAKALERPLIDHTLRTELGVRVGTPAYMSPEQFDESGSHIDTRTDVYSLGVVLHELLVGGLPDFRTRRSSDRCASHRRTCSGLPVNASQTIAHREDAREIATRRATDARALAGTVRGDLDAILLKALEEDPDRRYPSVAELSAELERYLQREPVLARAPTLGYRLIRAVQKNRGFFTVLGTIAAVLTIGFAVSTFLFVQHKWQRDRLFLLSDGVVLSNVVRDAERLAPATAEVVPAMRRWLEGPARDLVDRLPRHRRELAAMLRRAGVDSSMQAAFDDPQVEFEYRLLSDLVAHLDAFVEPEVGLFQRTRKRMRFAQEVRRLSVEAHRTAWHDAIESIAGRDLDSAYGGLRIAAQIGLVPLGRDPDSGLWEFGHLETGSLPTRDPFTGRLLLTEATGLVFVLLPGGSFDMGARAPTGSMPAAHPNVDPLAGNGEQPVHRVTLSEPFFISKYEMTVAQWMRVIGDGADEHPPSRIFAEIRRSGLHPVDGVSWTDAARAMRYLGLQLPTEAQWEYAARAGTSTRWWTGGDSGALRRIANVADLSFQTVTRSYHRPVRPWDDGYPYTAPVGSFEGNPFGIHDTIGNVSEWVRDAFAEYRQPARSTDGLRRADGPQRLSRGGAFENDLPSVSRRLIVGQDKRWSMGLRPTRVVQ